MFLAIILLIMGIILSLSGLKFIRLLLPLVGLVAGAMAGFTGFQAVFGTGVISTTVAIFMALAVGVLLMLLSFFFFELAIFIYTALLGASVFGYLGIALGVGNSGFVMFLLSLTGFIIGAVVASSPDFSANLIMVLTAFGGAALILGGVFLIAGHVSVDQLNENGIISTVLGVIDQSILWFFVWLGGSLVALQAQMQTRAIEVFGNRFEYHFENKTK